LPVLPCGFDSPGRAFTVTAQSRSVGGFVAQDDKPYRRNWFKPRKIAGCLFAEAGLHRYPLATFGAPARQHCGSALGLHTRTESVLLRALTPVWLESALGHEKSLLLIRSMALRQTVSINDLAQPRQSAPAVLAQGRRARVNGRQARVGADALVCPVVR
jgi:hypothetical protein